MFDNLTDRLQDTLQKVQGQDKLSKDNVDSALREVRKALIEADVSLTASNLFLSRVRKRAVGSRVVRGLTPSQKFIQIVNQEMVELLGGKTESLSISGNRKPQYIMLMGLQGAGKTTTAAKLALTLQKENKKVMLVALDLQRPAAIEQLEILGQSIDVAVHKDLKASSPLEVAAQAQDKAQAEGIEVLIFDTAGRLQVDHELMAELLLLDKKYKPSEKLLVVDSLIGQEAAQVAQAFDTQIGLTGCILTKLDGDSRGGAALSLVESTGKKIKFAGMGEKIEALEIFDPERMAGRILGFGDVIALVQKAEEQVDKEEASRLEAKLKKGQLDFETFLGMQRMLSKLGGFSQVFNLMGMGSMLSMKREQRQELLEEGHNKLKAFEYIIQSMTITERKDPSLMSNGGRIRRVARGAGCKEAQVRQLLGEFEKMRGTVKMLAPMLGGGGNNISPQDLLQAQKQQKKQQKKERKGESPFGGGSFLRF